MKNVSETWCIQIDVTNKCENKCANCTHLTQYCNNWEMDVDVFKQAINSLVDSGWNKHIGIIGGNPIHHSRFPELAEYVRLKIGEKGKRGLWISSYGKYEQLIKDVFGYINFNDHKEIVEHQPVLCALEDIIPDESLRRKLIDNCWVADIWSPSVTPKGVYRCEVMGSMDMALNYNLGLPIQADWHKRPIEDFQEQINAFCNICSCCVPMQGRLDKDGIDDITPSNCLRFAHCNRVQKGETNIVDPDTYDFSECNSKNWRPQDYVIRLRQLRDATGVGKSYNLDGE